MSELAFCAECSGTGHDPAWSGACTRCQGTTVEPGGWTTDPRQVGTAAEVRAFVVTEAREKVEPELHELFDLGVKGAGAMVIVTAARSLVAAVRAEERSRVTVEQIEATIRAAVRGRLDIAEGGWASTAGFTDAAQAVHRLITGETP